MQLLRKLLVITVILVGLACGLWFAVENNQALAVTLFGMMLPELTSGLWLTLFLLLGVLLGMGLSWLPVVQITARHRQLQRKLANRERELEAFRESAQQVATKG